MFDIGWTELLVIGVVALIVVGPKDLPGMFRALGKFTAKARSMAREFSRAMEDAAKESGVDEVAKDLKGMSSPRSFGLDKLQEATDKFDKWDPLKSKSAEAGPATKALSEERAATAKKYSELAAQKASERQAAEAAKAAEAAAAPAKPAKAASAAKPKAAKPKATKPAAAKPAAAKPKAPKARAATKAPGAPKPTTAAKPRAAAAKTAPSPSAKKAAE